MFFLPLITVLIVLIPTIPLKYNITNTSFTSSHLLPPLILTPALSDTYHTYTSFLNCCYSCPNYCSYCISISYCSYCISISYCTYLFIHLLHFTYAHTLFAILHFWLDAKLHSVAYSTLCNDNKVESNLESNHHDTTESKTAVVSSKRHPSSFGIWSNIPDFLDPLLQIQTA